MNQLSSAAKALAAVLLLAACVAATAQYGGSSSSRSAPGTGPADGAGYLLGVAAAALAVAAFVWT